MAFDIEGKVIAILAERAGLGVTDVWPHSTLVSLGIDSIGLVESIFAIEEAFDISVPFNANTPLEAGFDVSSVATLAAAVKGLIAQRAA